MAIAELKRGKHDRIMLGHPWVFSNEIERVRGELAPGDIVDVVDARGLFIGRGYHNPASQITIRLITRKEETVDDAFWHARLQRAVDFRKRFLPGQESYRVVHAEADFIPGLVIDKFGDYLVFQSLTRGIERWKESILASIQEILSPKGVYERDDVPVRELEGLEQKVGFCGESFDPMIDIDENGVAITVDVQRGQKTGYFLDQRDNRLAMRQFCDGARVLDCFCYTGGFALSAWKGGAAEVTGIDQAQSAVDLAYANALKNNATSCRFEAANAFDYLRTMQRRDERFDVVILDPPAFAKSRSALENAVRGYKEINLRAMRILNPGGTLVTCSCSYHMEEALLYDIALDAARDAGVTLRLIEKRGQAKDHPVLAASPETNYLKCFFFEVS
jgi:23S rRNA (cytosine1962-C5)-methyltransferase